MHVFDLIKRRRSIGKMTGERPTREQIERLLEAATHAPNHHKVQPWKFIVLHLLKPLSPIITSSRTYRRITGDRVTPCSHPVGRFVAHVRPLQAG